MGQVKGKPIGTVWSHVRVRDVRVNLHTFPLMMMILRQMRVGGRKFFLHLGLVGLELDRRLKEALVRA